MQKAELSHAKSIAICLTLHDVLPQMAVIIGKMALSQVRKLASSLQLNLSQEWIICNQVGGW